MATFDGKQIIPAASLPRRPLGRSDALVGVSLSGGELATVKVGDLPVPTSAQESIDALIAGQQSSAIWVSSLSALNSLIGTYVGQGAFVTEGEGTGMYGWNGTAWVFLSDNVLSSKLNRTEFEETIGEAMVAAERTPIVADLAGKVALWLEDGKLAAAGVAEAMIDMIEPRFLAQNGAFPLAVDTLGRVPLWIADGALDGVAIGGRFQEIIRSISRQVASSMVEPSVTGRQAPLRTDGQSLRRWLARLNAVKSVGGQVRVALTGDSWTEHMTIITQLALLLRGELGTAGSGWVTLVGQGINRYDGVWIQNSAGWTLYDADVNLAPPADGCGPNGQALVTSTTGQTINISGIEHGDTLLLYLGAFDGTIAYTVDGGEAVTFATTAGGGAVQALQIALPATGTHTVVLTVTSGKIAFYGALVRASTGNGVEISRVGNIGATGADYLQFVDTWTPRFASAINPDLVLVVLGTNDFRLSRGTVAAYQDALRKIVAAYRTANADCGFVFIAPAQCADVGIVPLSRYRDAMYEVARQVGAEFFNMNESWGSYASENALGQWRDVRHISDAGAKRLVASLSPMLLGN